MQVRMHAALLPALVAVAALAAPTLEAQVTRERVRVGDPRALADVVLTRRVRLGVNVRPQASATDSVGAYIEAVTPGGPADKAGIQSGDIITKLDGTRLVTGRGAEAGEGGQSLPGLRLIELAARLEPSDTIEVEVRRGRETKTLSLVTAEDPVRVFSFNGPGEGRGFSFRMGPDGPEGLPGMPERLERMQVEMDRMMGDGQMRVFMMSPLANVELAPLNADLGAYFGTTDGVLVISVPKESTLGLKGGDVVQGVDGRKVTSPSQLLRILGTYEKDEAIKFDVMRSKRRETVSGKAAAGTQWRRAEPLRLEPSRKKEKA